MSTIKVDERTGLPELPADCWWHVEKRNARSDRDWDRLTVGIMTKVEKLSYWRSKPTGIFEDGYIFRHHYDWGAYAGSDDPESFIFDAACKLMDDEATAYFRAQNQKERVTALLGNYPPKRLDTPR